MIKIKSRPSKNYLKFSTIYSDWPKFQDLPHITLFDYQQPYFYFSKDGREFLYISNVYGFFIPEESKLTVDEILEDNIDFSNWKLEKVDNNTDEYLRNEFLRGGFSTYSENFDFVFGTKDPVTRDVNGSWELIDKDDNIKIRFSLKLNDTYWGATRLDIGFPEKTKVPFDRSLIHRKELFIVHLLHNTWMPQ